MRILGLAPRTALLRRHRGAGCQQFSPRPSSLINAASTCYRIDRGVRLGLADTAVSSPHGINPASMRVQQRPTKRPTFRPTWPVARLASHLISLQNSRVRCSPSAIEVIRTPFEREIIGQTHVKTRN